MGTNQASSKARLGLVRKSSAWIGSNGSSNQTKPPSQARLKKTNQTQTRAVPAQLGLIRLVDYEHIVSYGVIHLSFGYDSILGSCPKMICKIDGQHG